MSYVFHFYYPVYSFVDFNKSSLKKITSASHHKYHTSPPSALTENTNKVAASSHTLNQTPHSHTLRHHKSSTQKYNFFKYAQTLQGHHHSQLIHSTKNHYTKTPQIQTSQTAYNTSPTYQTQ